MNYRMILSLLGDVLLVIGAFLLLPCIVAVIYGEPELWVLLATAAGSGLLGGLFILLRPKRRRELHARDGFVMVALSWILISLVGAIPFTVSGAIPSYLDAVFETMSGFTTTGASILRAVEDLPKCLLFWRSFTHWLGGMGVLVFMLAIVPLSGESIYLLRAESPGPSVSKMVPKMRTSAAILYAIYCAMTLLQILFYRLGVLFGWGEITWFDSLCLAFGTAGTGGFSVRNSGLADYSAYLQAVTTVFMVLFGVNFSVYFFLLRRRFRLAWHNSEVRWYFIIIFGAIVLISANLLLTGGFFSTVFQTIHHVAFSVGSVITTTGFGTADFAKWPEFSKTVLLILMAIGACAGSTGGGMKVSRVLILAKTARAETVVLLSHKKPDGHINVKVEFGEGEGKVPLDNIAKRAEEYKPKERVTYKMIKEYIEAKYGFKVHTAYIAEVKRDLGLPMYDAPNAVEELKQPRKHPTAEKVEAIRDALKHFEVI